MLSCQNQPFSVPAVRSIFSSFLTVVPVCGVPRLQQTTVCFVHRHSTTGFDRPLCDRHTIEKLVVLRWRRPRSGCGAPMINGINGKTNTGHDKRLVLCRVQQQHFASRRTQCVVESVACTAVRAVPRRDPRASPLTNALRACRLTDSLPAVVLPPLLRVSPEQ